MSEDIDEEFEETIQEIFQTYMDALLNAKSHAENIRRNHRNPKNDTENFEAVHRIGLIIEYNTHIALLQEALETIIGQHPETKYKEMRVIGKGFKDLTKKVTMLPEDEAYNLAPDIIDIFQEAVRVKEEANR